MNQLSMLIRREFWEHRATFFVLPAVITGVFTAILAVFLFGFILMRCSLMPTWN